MYVKCSYFYLIYVVIIRTSQSRGFVLLKDNETNATTSTSIASSLLRIVGGVEVKANSLPYQAALVVNGNCFCGGAVISAQYILTAAHCTYNAKYAYVILGAQNWKYKESTQQIYKTTNFIVHHKFKSISKVQENDISLVKISHIRFNQYVRAIGLPGSFSGDYSGQLSVLSGWGATSDTSSAGLTPALRKVYLTVAKNSYCQKFYSDVTLISGQICTQPQDILSGVVGGCYGDSGGPLVRGTELIGILSFGGSKCTAGKPSVYTRIMAYRSWIRKYSGI
ncbi:brachyurin-like [Euwallacea similis]|uniref:brachyurin-like n=1 Tax=Euwallacea similis TaxID=1736056 RepID=UPI00344C3FCE